MSELLPCPFCGGEAELHPTYDMDTNEIDGWFAWCYNGTCECKPETGQFFTEAEAIAAWNSRAERTCEEYGSVRVWQSCNVWSHELSCGHEVDTLDNEPPNYCPNCGARVIKSDQ